MPYDDKKDYEEAKRYISERSDKLFCKLSTSPDENTSDTKKEIFILSIVKQALDTAIHFEERAAKYVSKRINDFRIGNVPVVEAVYFYTKYSWHVSRKELPKKDGYYLVRCVHRKSRRVKYVVLRFIQGTWRPSLLIKSYWVSAWKEIDEPEEDVYG